MFDLLIANGKLVTPSTTIQADLGVHGEKIAGIFAPGSGSDAERVIDADGVYVLPGGVDPHVHFDMELGDWRTQDDFHTGTIAAAFGGTTTILDFVFPEPDHPPVETFHRRREQADGKAVIDYSFHSVLTDGTEQTLHAMEELVDLGIASFKIFMVYRDVGLYTDDASLYAILQQTARLGALPMVHAENEQVVTRLTQTMLAEGRSTAADYPVSRPKVAEVEAVRRATHFAGEAGSALYVVHATCAEVAQQIRAARHNGNPVYGETCPHYLTLDASAYETESGYNYIMSPPLRTEDDNAALWNALAAGDLTTVGSDESAWDTKDKERAQESFVEAPPGLVGAETRLSVALSEGLRRGLSLNRLVELLSTNPAKLFGLYPRKGTLEVGSDADIVLFDPERTVRLDYENLHHNAGYSPFEGMEVDIVPVTTICRGQPVVENGQLVAPDGHGRFLEQRIDRAYLSEPTVR